MFGCGNELLSTIVVTSQQARFGGSLQSVACFRLFRNKVNLVGSPSSTGSEEPHPRHWCPEADLSALASLPSLISLLYVEPITRVNEAYFVHNNDPRGRS